MTLDLTAIDEFLAQHRVAVVGVSGKPSNFATTIVRELRKHDYDAIGAGRDLASIDGQVCYPSLGDVPGPVEGVIVMVSGGAALRVIEEAAAAGIARVWLFKGLGGKGAFSATAAEACRSHGMEVVEGACPMMFLEPVAGFHKVHHIARRFNRSLPKRSPKVA
jgi:uncharacterized protein